MSVSYYKSGQYEQRYRSKSFRVLSVVDGIGERRVHNLREASEKIGRIGKRFWFTHLSLIDAQSVLTHPIWYIAGDTEQHAIL